VRANDLALEEGGRPEEPVDEVSAVLVDGGGEGVFERPRAVGPVLVAVEDRATLRTKQVGVAGGLAAHFARQIVVLGHFVPVASSALTGPLSSAY
jgi:hypothetical protein